MPDLFPSRKPTFNHVAMSLAPDALDADGRKAITEFYGAVFGWQELPTMTVDRQRLILSAHTVEQFVFLIAEDQPMTAPRLDHFGMSVGSMDELLAAYARAAEFREHDADVDLIDPDVEDHEVLKIHNFYVRYRLPMMVEVQYWEFAS